KVTCVVLRSWRRAGRGLLGAGSVTAGAVADTRARGARVADAEVVKLVSAVVGLPARSIAVARTRPVQGCSSRSWNSSCEPGRGSIERHVLAVVWYSILILRGSGLASRTSQRTVRRPTEDKAGA